MTPGMLLAGLGGFALILAVWLNYRQEMARLRLPAPCSMEELDGAFNAGIDRAADIVESHTGGKPTLDTISATILAAKR